MKKCSFLIIVALAAASQVSLFADKGRGRGGRGQGGEAGAEAGEREAGEDVMIVLASSDTPFDVKLTEIVRVSLRGPANLPVAATVAGPAKLERKATLRNAVASSEPAAEVDTEFDIEPTARGTVTVKVVTKPADGSKPDTLNYSFTVK